MTDNLLQANM